MLNNFVPGLEDIGDATRARLMFYQGQRAVHAPLSGLGTIFRLPVHSADWPTPTLAAIFAFAAGRPLYLTGDTDAILTIDPSTNGATAEDRFAYLESALAWQETCFRAGAGRIWVNLASEKLHTVEGYYEPRNGTHPVLLGTASVDKSLTITSLATAATGTAELYTVTVGVSAELPDYVVEGWSIGLQNVCGDNSAEAFTGSYVVTSIAANRLSFTGEHWFPKGAPTDPTTIDTDTHAETPDPRSLDRSVVVIPIATLSMAPGSSGWDGGAIEGGFNVYYGEVHFKFLGLAYTGPVGSTHDLIFVGDGGWFECEDTCVLAGGGATTIRMNNRAGGFLNRTCFGGAGTCDSGIQTQDGASIQTLRCSGGGYKEYGLNAGLTSKINYGGIIASCNVGAQTNQGSTITISNCRITECETNLWAANGPIIGDDDTENRRAALGITWTNGGMVYGDFQMSGNTLDVFSSTPPNTLVRGGAWVTDIANNLKTYNEGVALSVANNAVVTSIISTGTGTAGRIIGIGTGSTAGIGFEVDIRVGTAGFMEQRHLGSEIVVGAGALASPLNAGKLTLSFFQDGSDWKFQILNEDGSARAYRIIYDGNIRMGTFA